MVYIRQKGTPKGNARPILNAQHMIDDDEPFFVFFADDFFRSEVPRAVQMLDVYKKTGKTIMSFAEVNSDTVNQYGIAEIGEKLDEKSFRVKSLYEKPEPADSPSLMAQTGAYILTPDIMDIIKREIPGKGGELVLGDSISELAQNDKVYGVHIKGVWHDTGNPLKYLQAVTDIALESPKYGAEFAEYLKKRLC